MKDWPDYDGSVPVPETMTRPAAEVTGGLRRAADVVPPAAQPNYLASEIRGILDDLHDADHGAVPKRLVRERLVRLAETVETTTATETSELDLMVSGLEPDQEIRARAAEIIGSPSQLTVDSVERWRRTVDQVADYIRDGSKP